MSGDRRHGRAGLAGPEDRGRATALWQALRRRDARRELVRWARPFGRDLTKAWRACPRGSWAIETAARMGVERTLVARAVEDCVRDVEARQLPVGTTTRNELRHATDSWLQAGVPTHTWITTVEAFLFEAVDSDPEVRRTRRRVEQAHRWGDRAGMVEASDAYDDAYSAARKRFANIVTGRISADAIATALHGPKPHPYR